MVPDPPVPVLAQEASAAVTSAEQASELRRPQVVGGLNDTVFGLAITLLATAINITPADQSGKILAQLTSFAYAFFIIALIWLRRYQLVRRMRIETEGFLRLNFVLLFLIISYTYILRLFVTAQTSSQQSNVLVLFAVLTTLVNLTVAVQHQYALFYHLVAPADRPHVVRVRNAVLITAIAFAVSIPFAIASAGLSFIVIFWWLLSVPVTLIYRRLSYVQEQRQTSRAKKA